MSNLPNTTKPQYDKMLKRWVKIDDLTDGIDAIKTKGEAYLIKGQRESTEDFGARLKHAEYFDMFNPTIDGLAGIALAKKPAYGEDVPQEIVTLLENADNAGNHIDTLTAKWFKGAIRKGIYYMLIDAPAVKDGETPRNKAEENQRGLRPYSVLIDPKQIINWRIIVENGVQVLDMAVIKETITTYEGYSEATSDAYRVLRRGSFEVYTVRGNQATLIDSGNTKLSYIPLIALDLDDELPPMEAKPPLYDVCNMNISHYNKGTDVAATSFRTNNPLFSAVGVTTDEYKLVVTDGNSAFVTANPDASFSWIESKGDCIETTRNLMKDLEERIAIMGLSVLTEKGGNVTATERILDAAHVQSKMSIWIERLKDALENMLIVYADYLNLTSGGTVTVNKEMLRKKLTPEEINSYSGMVLKGQLSVETLWLMLQAHENLPDDFDSDIERERIATEGATV